MSCGNGFVRLLGLQVMLFNPSYGGTDTFKCYSIWWEKSTKSIYRGKVLLLLSEPAYVRED